MMQLLLTRPEQDSKVLAAQLIGMGHRTIIEPLLRIEALPLEDIDPQDVQALIATSRNAIRAAGASPQLDGLQQLPLFAVGPGTAATAQALGFQHVIEGPRDGRALVALIALRAEVNAGPLVYLAGNVTAADVGGELRRLGFHVLEPVVYSATPATALTPATSAAIAGGRIDGVLLLSPRTARTYSRLVKRHGLEAAALRITHLCLSPAVALALSDIPELHVATANAPNLKEMLALVARTTPQSR